LTLGATITAAACQAPDVPEGDRETDPPAYTTQTSKSDSPGWWIPDARSTWQWQLSSPDIDHTIAVDIYDIDLFEADPSTVADLQAYGSRVVCYLNAGAWEDWRPDAAVFPEQVLGLDYQGWQGERWLDIRQLEELGPIMEARLDLCQSKGFDGVEPDNIDGYQNETGFPLTYADQLAYNLWLASQAHSRGLSIALKNDSEQAADLVNYYDWALAEDCFTEGWCQDLAPFLEAGKAVFAAEYTDRMTPHQFRDKVCPQARISGISVILKHRNLDAWQQECP